MRSFFLFLILSLTLSSEVCWTSPSSLSSQSPAQVKTILSGETLFSLLIKNGFSKKERQEIFARRLAPKKLLLVPGHRYLLIKKPNELQLKIYEHESDITHVFSRISGKIHVLSKKENFEIKTQEVSGQVKGSLITSINKEIKETLVAYKFMNAFLLDHNLKRDIKRGAKFYLAVEKKFDQGHFIKFGEVLIAALEIKGKIKQKVFVPFGQEAGVFLAQEDFSSKKPLYAPVDKLNISSLFQRRRKHPIKGRRQAHLGIDFALPRTSPTYAVADGEILRTGRTRAAGKFIVVQHKNKIKSYYNHLYKINAKIKKGVRIRAGQVVGQIGCTGYCTKPHLHFAIRKGSRMVDPARYLKNYPAHAEKKLKRSFAQIAQKIKQNPARQISRAQDSANSKSSKN